MIQYIRCYICRSCLLIVLPGEVEQPFVMQTQCIQGLWSESLVSWPAALVVQGILDHSSSSVLTSMSLRTGLLVKAVMRWISLELQILKPRELQSACSFLCCCCLLPVPGWSCALDVYSYCSMIELIVACCDIRFCFNWSRTNSPSSLTLCHGIQSMSFPPDVRALQRGLCFHTRSWIATDITQERLRKLPDSFQGRCAMRKWGKSLATRD